MIDLDAFYKISYGIYIVSSKYGDKTNGQIVNSVFQVSANPIIIAISINKENLTHRIIKESGYFSLSCLAIDTPMPFIGKFGFKSGKDIDKFSDTSYKLCENGTPAVTDFSTAIFELKLENEIDVYTHTIFIGRVLSSELLSDAAPLTYDYYRAVKKGISPKNAPTYINKNLNLKEDKKMSKYRCTICGYEYDPKVGDPDGNIAAGTAFEDIPDDWTCPICGASKEDFEKID